MIVAVIISGGRLSRYHGSFIRSSVHFDDLIWKWTETLSYMCKLYTPNMHAQDSVDLTIPVIIKHES